jgi:hypothetical protein
LRKAAPGSPISANYSITSSAWRRNAGHRLMRPGSVSKAEMLMSLPEPPFVARSVALIGHLVNCPAAWVTCAASDFVVRLPQAQFAGRRQHVRHVKLHHDSQYMRRDTTRREVTDGEDRIARLRIDD